VLAVRRFAAHPAIKIIIGTPERGLNICAQSLAQQTSGFAADRAIRRWPMRVAGWGNGDSLCHLGGLGEWVMDW
jgi:hypothetical protein